MSTSQAVAQHLPYLRRYARALSGSQASGDAYVAATLEALVQDLKCSTPGFLPGSPSIGFSQKYGIRSGSTESRAPPAPASQSSGIWRKFRQSRVRHSCWSPSRDFRRTMPQRCSISTRRRCGDLVEESGRELAAEIATDVLIIEDETFIALDLEGLGREPRPSRARRCAHARRGRGARAKRSGPE